MAGKCWFTLSLTPQIQAWHAHYGQERSKTFADYKAVSQNVMHSSTKITEQTYSNLNDGEVQKRVTKLTGNNEPV